MESYSHQTVEMFKNIIARPKLNERVLEKPSFRLIFDIISETTKETNFARGLYTKEQLNPNHYLSRAAKEIYFQKIIKLVELMSGKQIRITPVRIVGGLDPELINEFLQILFKCAVGEVPSGHFVAIVNGDNEKLMKQEKFKEIFENMYARREQQKSKHRKEIMKTFIRSLKQNYPKKEKLSFEQSCKVCLNSPLQMINNKCFHYCVCMKCSTSLRGICPICRTQGEFKRIYKA